MADNRGTIKKDICVSAVFEKELLPSEKSKFQKIQYLHKIKMQNGDEGQYKSDLRQQIKFVVGQECTYQAWIEKTAKKDGTGFWEFKKIAPYYSNPAKSQGSHYDKPEVIISITKTEMLHEANKIALEFEKAEVYLTFEQICALQKVLYKYCFQDTGESRPDSMQVMKRRSSVKMAVEVLPLKSSVKRSDAILAKAKEFYDFLMK